MTDPAVFLLLGGLGIWAAVDGTSVGQLMISRPLVVGILAGVALGAPGVGALVGGILELLHLGNLPLGGARFPEPGPAAVPAVLAATLHPGPGGIAAALGLGILMAKAGGASMGLLRRWNTRIVDRASEREGGIGRRVGRTLALCLALDAVRGAVIVGVGMALALALPREWTVRWPVPTVETVGLLLVAGFLSLGTLASSPSRGRRGPAVLVAGLAVGLALGLLAW